MHQNHFLKFSLHLSVRKSHKKLQTNNYMENLKQASGEI